VRAGEWAPEMPKPAPPRNRPTHTQRSPLYHSVLRGPLRRRPRLLRETEPNGPGVPDRQGRQSDGSGNALHRSPKGASDRGRHRPARPIMRAGEWAPEMPKPTPPRNQPARIVGGAERQQRGGNPAPVNRGSKSKWIREQETCSPPRLCAQNGFARRRPAAHCLELAP
jgi:hypothetical protein